MLCDMKAMILAAGIGSRLGALTQSKPKCLMPLGNGETILDDVATKLIKLGVSEIVINTHHFGALVQEHVLARKSYGISVHFSEEDTLLDTGGALKKAQHHFEGESAFYLHNADIYCTADLSLPYATHIDNDLIATLICMKRPSARGIFVNAEKRLIGWTGEDRDDLSGTNVDLLAFSGISICSPELFNFMPETDTFSILECFLHATRSTGRVKAFEIEASTWLDIGTPEKLNTLQNSLGQSDDKN